MWLTLWDTKLKPLCITIDWGDKYERNKIKEKVNEILKENTQSRFEVLIFEDFYTICLKEEYFKSIDSYLYTYNLIKQILEKLNFVFIFFKVGFVIFLFNQINHSRCKNLKF